MIYQFVIKLFLTFFVTGVLARLSTHEARHFTRAADIESSYDYIVVGGGTSGLTVADRLTEDGNCKYEAIHCSKNIRDPITRDF